MITAPVQRVKTRFPLCRQQQHLCSGRRPGSRCAGSSTCAAGEDQVPAVPTAAAAPVRWVKTRFPLCRQQQHLCSGRRPGSRCADSSSRTCAAGEDQVPAVPAAAPVQRAKTRFPLCRRQQPHLCSGRRPGSRCADSSSRTCAAGEDQVPAVPAAAPVQRAKTRFPLCRRQQPQGLRVNLPPDVQSQYPVMRLWAGLPAGDRRGFSVPLLSSLGVAFFSLGIYIRSHEITNPDVPQVWNTVLQSLSKLKFCPAKNESLEALPALVGHGSIRRRPDPDPLAYTTTWQPSTTVVSTPGVPVSVSLLVPMSFELKEPFKRFYSNITHLRAVVTGNLLGLGGSEAKELINIMLMSPWLPEHYLSQVNSTNTKSLLTCITMTAAAHVLTQARYFPSCSLENLTDASLYQTTLAENSEKAFSQGHTSVQCYVAQYKPEPKFTVLLSEKDRILCSQHLLNTSYILILLALVIFWVSVAAGLRKKLRHKATNLHKVHLLEM
ncbi:transmembrane protein 248-like [Pristis pectinata]|uniref:transmembrane protein 248-like n=1 Tax=Pristis pectinata TaxID=685728 RepID=UPI00223E4A72|nr:transmembrane protein 248-like [Pristis pectinata]